MRIRISDLSARGIKINEQLAAELFNQRLGDKQSEIKAISPISLVGEIKSISHMDAELTLTLSAEVVQNCSSCSDPKPHVLSNELNLLLKPIPEGAKPQDYEDDVGISFYRGEHVEINDLALESLILAIDLYWHPERNSSDICLVCNKDCKIKVIEPEAPKTLNPFASLSTLKK